MVTPNTSMLPDTPQRMIENDTRLTTLRNSPTPRLKVSEVKLLRSSEIRWSGLSV
ncbi:hypothetical protein D3C73_1502380 [compost metagenome]